MKLFIISLMALLLSQTPLKAKSINFFNKNTEYEGPLRVSFFPSTESNTFNKIISELTNFCENEKIKSLETFPDVFFSLNDCMDKDIHFPNPIKIKTITFPIHSILNLHYGELFPRSITFKKELDFKGHKLIKGVFYDIYGNLEASYTSSNFNLHGLIIENFFYFNSKEEISGGGLGPNPPYDYKGFKLKDNICFFNDGEIRFSQLYEPTEINGLIFENHIEFHKNKDLKRGYLVGQQTVEGILAYGSIDFHQDLKPYSIQLVNPTTIQEVEYKMYVNLYENGIVESGYINEVATVQGIKFSQSIGFHPNGKLHWGTLDHPSFFKGLELFNSLSFYPNGSLKLLNLLSPGVINGTQYPGGSSIRLDQNGKVISTY